ncbi:putative ribonuclease H-like domain-containing protein [Tanacetum coccineum]
MTPSSGILKDFIRQIENQLNQKVKTIRCDNGTEFKNKDVIEFCGSKGIKREYSNARTPQQNGVAERKNRTLIEAARDQLEQITRISYIHAGQQEANHNAGTEDIIDAGDSEKEDESAQDCFMKRKKVQERKNKPFWMNLRGKKRRQEKEANEEAEALRKKFEHLVIKEGAARPSSTNIFSTVSTPAKASSTNLVNTVSLPVSTASLHEGLSLSDPTNPEEDDSEIPPLEDIYQNSTDGIFTTSSYDDEGAVADFTNLETVVNVSPIPTSRIHSTHPKALILGDPTSAVQTRSKLHKSSGAHAFVSYVQKQRRNNHKDFQHCLFACFLSQHEPKKISEALEDESWVDAMQEELLQFEIQKVWVLVDLPYGVRYKVVKALYGLHQAPRAWYATLSTFLLKNGTRRGHDGLLMDLTASRTDIMFCSLCLFRFQMTHFLAMQKQTMWLLSTSEAEYVTAASMLWAPICIVKESCISFPKQSTLLFRHHFHRDAYEKKLIQVLKIHTDDNVADLLTKAFDVSRFQFLVMHFRGLIEFKGSLRRVTDGTEALLIPTLFILWLDKVSTASAKFVPLGKVCTAIKTLKKIRQWSRSSHSTLIRANPGPLEYEQSTSLASYILDYKALRREFCNGTSSVAILHSRKEINCIPGTSYYRPTFCISTATILLASIIPAFIFNSLKSSWVHVETGNKQINSAGSPYDYFLLLLK